ncbi:MAG: hypothetical protein MJZ95_00315 [Paludibacteraceae bacterium]|nr:hypothetical protein [Paludibacteraceae bacterium]
MPPFNVRSMSVVSPFKNGGIAKYRQRHDELTTNSPFQGQAGLPVTALVSAGADMDPLSAALRFENQLVEAAMLLDEEKPLLEGFALGEG